MIVIIGEILIDRFNDYERIGGAPFNFAFHLKNLGWPVQFITRIGDDADGLKILSMLKAHGFNPDDVQIDKRHITGCVDVSLDSNGIPHFDICENVAYDHIDLSLIPTMDGPAADMIYFGTLIQRTDGGLSQVQEFLQQHAAAAATCFCDINLRAPHINENAIEPALRFADILKLNDEELEIIAAICNGPAQKSDAVDWVMGHYNISKIALTHGAGGSTAITTAGTFSSPPEKTAKIVDTVGAGDAYAAVFAAGILKDIPMKRTLEMATAFSSRICGLPGAIPEDKQVYASLKKEFERTPNAQ